MRAELIHTSMPRGLDGGTGFAVAGRTGGMPRALADALSALSGLPEAWEGASDEARAMHATRCIEWQGEPRWVASVIRPCGLDHTGRGNRVAHHRLLDAQEIEHACPVAMLRDSARWMSTWAGAPRELETPDAIGPMPGAVGAAQWKCALGQDGIADAALEIALRSGVGGWIVVPAGSDRLGLLAELVAGLPLAERWSRGWSTRALRPSGGAVPVICVIDAREPALKDLGNPAWVIRADSLRPSRRTDRAVADAAPVRGAPARITWQPARRLEVAAVADAAPTQPDRGEVPSARDIPVAVTLEDAPVLRGTPVWWIAAIVGALVAVGWFLWKVRGA